MTIACLEPVILVKGIQCWPPLFFHPALFLFLCLFLFLFFFTSLARLLLSSLTLLAMNLAIEKQGNIVVMSQLN